MYMCKKILHVYVQKNIAKCGNLHLHGSSTQRHYHSATLAATLIVNNLLYRMKGKHIQSVIMGGGRDAGGQISSLGTTGTHGDPFQDFVEKKKKNSK